MSDSIQPFIDAALKSRGGNAPLQKHLASLTDDEARKAAPALIQLWLSIRKKTDEPRWDRLWHILNDYFFRRSTLEELYAAKLQPEGCLAEDALKSRAPWIRPAVAQWVPGMEDFDWPDIRSYIQAGLCDLPPAGHPYYRMLAADWFTIDFGKWLDAKDKDREKCSLMHMLEKHPDILTHDIFLALEFDHPDRDAGGRGKWNDFNVIDGEMKIHGNNSTWSHVLATLTREGAIDKARLCQSLVLLRNRPNVAPGMRMWCCDLLQRIDPDVYNDDTQCQAYASIVMRAQGPDMENILKAFTRLAKDGKLPASVLSACGDVIMALASKKHPLKFLEIVALVGNKTQTQERVDLIGPVKLGLAHAQREVQAAALKTFEVLMQSGDPAVLDSLREMEAFVAPGLKPTIAQLIAKAANPPPAAPIKGKTKSKKYTPETSLESSTAPPAASTSPAPSSALAELIAQAARLSPGLRAITGLDALCQAARELRPPQAFTFSISDIAYDRVAEPPPVINTFEEALDRLAQGYDSFTAYADLEYLIDALARLAPKPGSPEFALAAPMRHILAKSGGTTRDTLFRRCRYLFNQLLGGPRGTLLAHHWTAGLSLLMSRVLEGVMQRHADGFSLGLLFCPTHSAGWLDPLTLVQRLAAYEKAGAPIPLIDLAIAFLRLPATNRGPALKAATSLKGPHAPAVAYALGGNIKIPANPHTLLWASASRARDPQAHDPALPPKWSLLGADLLSPCTATWATGIKTFSSSVKAPVIFFSRDQPSASADARKLCYPAWCFDIPSGNAFEHAWLATLWPSMPHRFEETAARIASDYANSKGPASSARPSTSGLDPVREAVAPLAHTDRPIGTLGYLALAVALGGTSPAGRLAAAESLIRLIDDGKCTGETLASIMCPLIVQEVTLPARAAEGLTHIARASPLHAHVTARILSRLFSAIEGDMPPAGINKLLEILTQNGEPLDEACAAKIAAWASAKSSKAAPLAKELLKRRAVPLDHATREKILCQALESRLRIAQRWNSLI
jgi:hypothetical protein